jgi:hypothetical protein
MIKQATDARNPNDVSRRCRHIAGTKHGTVIDALMWSFVIEVGLKFSER